MVEIDDRSDRGGVNDLEQRHQSPGDHDRHDDCAEQPEAPVTREGHDADEYEGDGGEARGDHEGVEDPCRHRVQPTQEIVREPHEGVACEPVEQHQSDEHDERHDQPQ